MPDNGAIRPTNRTPLTRHPMGKMKPSKIRKGEKQYQQSIVDVQKRGVEGLGLMTSWAYLDDPKRLTFTFARY